MTTLLIRNGLCVGLVLAPLYGVLAQDIPDADPLPQPVPAVRLPPAFGPQTAPPSTTPTGPGAGPYWAPGGDMANGMRVGSPYYWSAPGMGPSGGWQPAAPGMGDGYGCSVGGGPGYGVGYAGAGGYGAGWGAGYGGLYNAHFGPGFYRNSNVGHTRFPYYSYRRPWYFPGPPSYNRDTNYPW